MDLAVVIVTRDRRASVLGTLPRLLALPERPRVLLVDNASTDGTAAAVRDAHPEVDVVALADNLGCAGRTVGVRAAGTALVAFSDDDSWWAPGALAAAASRFAAAPEVAVVAGRILVGLDERLDPVCVAMRDSPLGDVDGVGPQVLGFVACGAVVRSAAYLAAGGFERRYVIGGEERLLALDLAERGWVCGYAEDVVAHHHPAASRDPAARRAAAVRNDLWTSWLRRPATVALGDTGRAAVQARRDRATRRGLRAAVGGLGWVLPRRRPVGPATEAAVRLLERGQTGSRTTTGISRSVLRV